MSRISPVSDPFCAGCFIIARTGNPDTAFRLSCSCSLGPARALTRNFKPTGLGARARKARIKLYEIPYNLFLSCLPHWLIRIRIKNQWFIEKEIISVSHSSFAWGHPDYFSFSFRENCVIPRKEGFIKFKNRI